jgi:hypothetical protein
MGWYSEVVLRGNKASCHGESKHIRYLPALPSAHARPGLSDNIRLASS